jgi:predicted ribosome quality control (RQC) complex YloA/Tae2 family protein
MKTEIASLELHYLLKDFQALVGAKVEQIYQVGRDEFIFQLHLPGVGKRFIRIMLGRFIYLASDKGAVPEKPPGFCLYLRKKLKNARLKSTTQIGFERIVEIIFENKELRFKLVVEIFGKGNLIICDDKGIILSVLEQKQWKDRTVKPREQYIYPDKGVDVLSLASEQFINILKASDKENIVKSLAIDFGLGGVYAEEVCFLAKVDKTIKPFQLSEKELLSLHHSLNSLLSKDLSKEKAMIIYTDEKKQEIKDIVPFSLNFYSAFQTQEFVSFNSALDSVLTSKSSSRLAEKSKAAEKADKNKEFDKLNRIISEQELRISGLEKSEQENQRKAELIYENYSLVNQIIKEFSELRKTISLAELQEKFKGHKIIKQLDTKTGEITIEL